MKGGPVAVAAVFAGVLVLAGGLGWLLYEAGGGGTPPGATDGGPAAPDKPGPARRVHAEPEVPPETPPAPHERADVAKPIPKEGRLRFEFEGHPDLALRDWREVAVAFKGVCETFVEMAEKGAPQPDDKERIERIRKNGMRFEKAALTRPAGSAGIPDVTALEHPAFAVNLIAAILDLEKLPLTDAQARRLVDLAKERGPRYDEAMDALTKSDGTSWTLDLVTARAGVLESFFGEVHATLTAAQSAALVPDLLRNRTRADMLSGAIAWGRVAHPLHFTSDTELTDTITFGLGNQFSLLDRQQELRAIVEAWVKTAPFDTPDALDAKGFIRSQIVARAAPRMVDLLKRIIEGMQLPEETAAAARKVSEAYVPMRR